MSQTVMIGPTGRMPDYARGENQYARILADGTAVIVAHGAGMIHSVSVGVAGTLAKFYDTPSGGTTDDTTEIACIDLSVVKPGAFWLLDIDFSQGLTCVVTGSAADLTVSFRGAQTVSPRTFGV